VQPTDQLHIDTPEQIALELPLAGIGSRFLAFFVDTLLQVVLGVAVALLLLALPSGLAVGWFARAFGTLAPAAVVFFLFCLYWGYFAVFEAAWNGQTPGKRYAGIRVIKESGRPINAFEAVARNLLRAVDGLPGVYGVAVVSMMLNRENRRLGDFVAGTVVVHEHATEELRPYADAASGAGANGMAPSAGPISTDELLLIETYLQRRYDLDPEVRARTAGEIAARLRQRAGIEEEPGQSPDDFLEALAKRTRDGARFR
jgi:uncharacterized RDD family membrane protein YckC